MRIGSHHSSRSATRPRTSGLVSPAVTVSFALWTAMCAYATIRHLDTSDRFMLAATTLWSSALATAYWNSPRPMRRALWVFSAAPLLSLSLGSTPLISAFSLLAAASPIFLAATLTTIKRMRPGSPPLNVRVPKTRAERLHPRHLLPAQPQPKTQPCLEAGSPPEDSHTHESTHVIGLVGAYETAPGLPGHPLWWGGQNTTATGIGPGQEITLLTEDGVFPGWVCTGNPYTYEGLIMVDVAHAGQPRNRLGLPWPVPSIVLESRSS